MNRQKCMYGFFLVLVVALGLLTREVFSENRGPFTKKTIKAQLFSISSGNITLVDVEEKLGLNPPIKMNPPTTTDPLWWFVYEQQGLLIELGTNTEEPVFILEAAKRTEFYYTGYFKLMTPKKKRTRTEYSTYRVPTIDPVSLNKYSKYLTEYDMRVPISIKGLEIALELGEPVNVEVPAFINPMWTFFYRISNCTIRLYGTALRDNIGDEILAKGHRGEFLFTGYWTVGCQD